MTAVDGVVAAERWLSTREFAHLAAIDPRSAARICRQAANKPWNEAVLEVRRVKGRGGRAGVRYEVRQDTLPRYVLDRLLAAEPIANPAPKDRNETSALLRQRDKRARVARQRRDILAPILLIAPSSPERTKLIELVAAREGVSVPTLYRWLKAWQIGGLTGLAPSLRTRVTKPLIVSRALDQRLRDAGVSEDALDRLRQEVDHLIKATWASQLHLAGMREIGRHVGKQIRLYCKAAKFPIQVADWDPSPVRIRQFRDFRIVGIQAYDKERVSALMPRIRRCYEQLPPMAVVFVDVKYADIYVKTAKGERGRPVLVAFYDAATRRVFTHLKLLVGSEAVGGAAVHAGLCEMLMHPDWGIPGTLYTDNGSEMHELDAVLGKLSLAETCPVIRAMPYNPQAKPIEGVFANLNRLVFSKMQGFTGGKPRKLRNLLSGNRPVYPGTWLQFVKEFTILLDDYHRTRRSKPLSPQKEYEKKRRDMSHRPKICSIEQLTLALGLIEYRRIKQGSLMIFGERYTCPKLYEAVGDERVMVVLPPIDRASPLLVFDGEVFELTKENRYAPLDPAGAVEAESRKNAYNAAAFRRYLELGERFTHPADKIRLASHWLPKLKDVTHPVFAEQDPHVGDNPEDRDQDRQRWHDILSEIND